MAAKQQTPTLSSKVQDHLQKIANYDQAEIDKMVSTREAFKDTTQLDGRSFDLVKIAALVAVDAPPSSYLWNLANAYADGVTADDVLGTMLAVAPQVGAPRVIKAARNILVAVGAAVDAGDGR